MAPGLMVRTELVRSARRTRYFLLRVGYGVVLLVAMAFHYLLAFGMQGAGSVQAAAAFAASFLHTFAILQLCAVVLLGPALLAGTVARERQQRTLEYLLTTHLTNAEIVLGKLTAGLMQLLACLLVGLPVLSLAMLLGGIDPVGLALAIGVSVLCRRARDAVSIVYLFLLLLLAGPWLGQLLAGALGLSEVSRTFELLLRLNPFVVLAEVLGSSAAGAVESLRSVWWMVLGQTVFAGACAAAATALLRRASRSGWGEARRQTRSDRPLRRRPVGNHPMIWKEVFASRPATRAAAIMRLVGVVVLGLGALATMGMFVLGVVGEAENFTYFTASMGTALGCGAILLATARASNSIAGEKEQQTWGALLSTPLAPWEILVGKIVGQLYAVRWVGALLLVLWVLQCCLKPQFAVVVPLLATEVAVLTAAGVLLGLFFSLWCRTATRALGATMGVGLVVGLGCCPASCILPSPITMLTWPYFLILGDAQNTVSMMFLSGTVVIGIVMYASAGVGLYFACERNFDRFADRVRRRRGATWRGSSQGVRVSDTDDVAVSSQATYTATRETAPRHGPSAEGEKKGKAPGDSG
jgi:ABC-type transport system involved in multi-copper enzyme maturation permease subunit